MSVSSSSKVGGSFIPPTVDSTISFKLPVYYDEKENALKQVGLLGRILRYIPHYGRATEKKTMAVMEKNLANTALEPAERLSWVERAKTYDKHVLSRYRLSFKSNRMDFQKKLYISVLEALGLPTRKNIELNDKDYNAFVKFMRVNHLDKKMTNHSHRLSVNNNGVPQLMVNGEMKSWSEVKELKIFDEKTMQLNDDWSYLGKSDYCGGGLVQYNTKTWKREPNNPNENPIPLPYKKLSPEEIDELREKGITLPYIENIVDCRAKVLPERALENNDHAFKKMVDKDGNVYYFGLSPKEEKSFLDEARNALASHAGVIESPDHYVDVPPAIRDSKVQTCTEDQFKLAFNYIVKTHNEGLIYNAFGDNCIGLVLGADRIAGLKVPTEDKIKTQFYKLFPKPLQALYKWTPLPMIAKRYLCRKVLNLFGYNKGIGEGGIGKAINAASEFTLKEDLMISHPRLYYIFLQSRKANGGSVAE